MTAAAPCSSGAGVWAGGAALSLLAHVAVLGVLALALRPAPFPEPARPQVQVRVKSEPVERGSANPVAPDAPQAASAAPTGARTAAASAPPVQRPNPVAAVPLAASAVTPSAEPTEAVAPPAPTRRAAPPAPVAAVALPGQAPAPIPLELASAAPPALPQTLPELSATRPAPTPAPLPESPGAPSPLPEAAPSQQPAPALTLPSERQFATLAPEATGLLPAEALVAFLRPGDIVPGDAGALAVRDGIAATLAQFPCARIQSGFNPDTGSLDLRGHIPDPAMRDAVIGSLQAQLGSDVPVTGELLILPRPQCQMLAAIDALGLPQSSEQYTNPRVIGADAHVRDYRFVEGDRLELELTAPDYPAWVMVDYFDAQGQVLHLQPNADVPPVLFAPKATLTIGRASDGQPALDITISPPYGQEIAVAYAASAPIFDTSRPLAEPAAPYLADLARRIADARAADPGFRGEWVYFFVTTAPR